MVKEGVGPMRDSEDRLIPLLRDVAGELDSLDGTAGWISALRFGVAGALAEGGEDDLAAAVFQRLLSEVPAHLWARIGLIDILLRQGRSGEAVSLGREGLSHLPGERLLWRKTAEAVEIADGPAAAAALLTSTEGSSLDPSDLRYAIGLFRSAGAVAGAEAFCRQLLSIDPADPLAHMAGIEAALQTGAPGEAAERAAMALVHDPRDAELILRIGQGFYGAGDFRAARDTLSRAPGGTAFAQETQALLARVEAEMAEDEAEGEGPSPGQEQRDDVLAVSPVDWAGRIEALEIALVAEDRAAAEAAATRLIDDPGLPWYQALSLVERAVRAGHHAAATRLSARFDRSQWSEAERQAFAIEDLVLRSGPLHALDWVRAHPVGRRDREAAERLGRILLSGGTGPLAARYLRACCRRWPDDAPMLRLAVEALVASGQVERAATVAEGNDEAREAGVAAAMASGALARALGMCRGQGMAPRDASMLIRMIELNVLVGDLAGAEDCLAQLSPEDGPLADALICRPRATRVGTLLNEARILSAQGIDWVSGTDDDLVAGLEDAFFLPARRLLDRLLDGGAAPSNNDPGQTVGTIEPPQTLHLVWPSPSRPSEEAERVFAAWRARTQRDLRVVALQDAPGWLQEHAAADTRRAFAMAPDAAQKTDLLALATLFHAGGCIALADQWPSRDIDALLDGLTAPLFFRDGTGALVTDFIAAPRAHPIVELALEMAVSSCLSRENDHRWFKTGPGLLTRAASRILARGAGEGPLPAVRAAQALRHAVHPHTLVAASGAAARPCATDRVFGMLVKRMTSQSGSGPTA